MPLSDEEERVLAEIERQFTVDAPATQTKGRGRYAVGVPSGSHGLVSGPSKAAGLVLLSVVFTAATFPLSVVLGVAGFGGVMVAAIMLVRALLTPWIADD